MSVVETKGKCHCRHVRKETVRQSSTKQTTAVAAAGVGVSPRVRRPPLGTSPVARNNVPGRHGNQFQLTTQPGGRWRNTVAD